MTDYNLLAKAEIEKYQKIPINSTPVNDEGIQIKIAMSIESAKAVAAQAQQGIIEVLEEVGTSYNSSALLLDEITHHTTLKQHIENYKA